MASPQVKNLYQSRGPSRRRHAACHDHFTISHENFIRTSRALSSFSLSLSLGKSILRISGETLRATCLCCVGEFASSHSSHAVVASHSARRACLSQSHKIDNETKFTQSVPRRFWGFDRRQIKPDCVIHSLASLANSARAEHRQRSSPTAN